MNRLDFRRATRTGEPTTIRFLDDLNSGDHIFWHDIPQREQFRQMKLLNDITLPQWHYLTELIA